MSLLNKTYQVSLKVECDGRLRCLLEDTSGRQVDVPLNTSDLRSKSWIVVDPPETIDDIKCDRCGKFADFCEGGGVCDDCGDNLCWECAQWTSDEDDERCGKCRGEAKIKFKPCPFCDRTDVRLDDRHLINFGENHNRWFVYCNYCGIGRDGFATEQEAIDWWNTRPNKDEEK
jgi:hypothetical protein